MHQHKNTKISRIRTKSFVYLTLTFQAKKIYLNKKYVRLIVLLSKAIPNFVLFVGRQE